MRWFIFILLSSAVLAADLSDARVLYVKGEFLAAAKIAAALETSEGFSFAARAMSEHANEQPRANRDELYSLCEKYARKAVQLNSKNADGYFEIAASVGQLASLRDVSYAITNGVATQVKDNLEKAIELNPRHWFAILVLGRWNAEMHARGVAWLYGASAERANSLLEQSLAIAPKRILVRVEMALALLILEPKANRERAKKLLETALKLEPLDAAERKQLERAKRELAELK